jgi:Xaa-Pro aminopeptidase
MKSAILIIDSPVKNLDLYYTSSFYCMDPFVYLEINGEKIGFLPSTEIEKAKIKSSLTKFYNLSYELLKIDNEKKYPMLKSSLVIDILNANEIKEIIVPYSMSVVEATNLVNNGFTISTIDEPFFKERITKNERELSFIRENSKSNVEVMNEIKNILAASTIENDNTLKYDGEILSVERLQRIIFHLFLERDLTADSMITAVGNDGVFPHEEGKGLVYANTSIIVDIYPKNIRNHYYTDMTRTFCKGHASDDLKKIYQTVYDAQRFAMDKVYANEDGKIIHEFVEAFFYNKGYKTKTIDGILQGFFHGTGHGLGLECHEAPKISIYGTKLPKNSVVSVEPGLYYIGLGAVRIEDLVIVRDSGIENLTNYEKKLEIE